MYKLKQKKIQIKYQWFIPYLLILSIPIFMSIFILINMQMMINKERTIEGSLQIENVISRVEREISLSRMASNNFRINKHLDILLNETHATGEEWSQAKDALCTDIREYVVNNKIEDNVYIYLYKFQIIMDKDGAFTPWDYWQRNYKMADISYSEWKSALDGGSITKYRMYPVNWMDKNEKVRGQSFLHIEHLKKKTGYNYAVMSIQSNNEVNYDDSMANAHFVIYDESGEAVYSLKDISREMLPVLRKSSKEKICKVDGKNYVVENAQSKDTGFLFVVAVELYNTIHDFWVITCYFAAILLISMICVWRIWKTSNENYTVVDEILERLKKYRTETESDNEISMINRIVDKVIAENRESKLQIVKQRNQFKIFNIGKLLKGNVSSFRIMQESLPQEERIDFLSDYFSVMAVMIDDYSGFAGESNEEQIKNIELVWFAVRNVAEEIIQEMGNKVYFVDMEEIPVFLISFDEKNKDEGLKQIAEGAGKLKSFLENQLKIFITVSVSDVYTGIEGIRLAYNEAMETMGYRFIFGDGMILTPEDTKVDDSHKYKYTQENEIKLSNSIQSGNYTGAEMIINSLINFEDEQNIKKVKRLQFMIYDIAATLVRISCDYASSKSILNEGEFMEGLLAEKDLETMKNMLLNSAKKLCTDKEESSINFLAKKVTEYVEINYFNIELSVASIAENFHFNANYISNMFKEQTGMGLLEFINKTRINKSIRLLEEINYSINVISESVGYINTNTYIRIFKKFMGTTPSKYRLLKTTV